jgi:GAF domain-containing protein
MLAQTVPEQDLLQASIESLVGLIQAKYGAIGVLDEEGNLVRLLHAGAGIESGGSTGRHPMGGRLLGLLIRDRAAWGGDERMNDTCLPFGQTAMTSMLAVPVSSRGRVYATVYLGDKLDRSAFTEEDEEVASNFVSALVFVLENSRRSGLRKRARRPVIQQLFGRKLGSCHRLAS